MSCCASCAKTGRRCISPESIAAMTTDAGIAKPGVGAATPTVFITDGTTATPPSSTSTYFIVGGSALAIGILGAILYSRHR